MTDLQWPDNVRHVHYEDIPLPMRIALSEVYSPDGVEHWWNAKNASLEGETAAAWWYAGRRKDVEMVVDLIVQGSW